MKEYEEKKNKIVKQMKSLVENTDFLLERLTSDIPVATQEMYSDSWINDNLKELTSLNLQLGEMYHSMAKCQN